MPGDNNEEKYVKKTSVLRLVQTRFREWLRRKTTSLRGGGPAEQGQLVSW